MDAVKEARFARSGMHVRYDHALRPVYKKEQLVYIEARFARSGMNVLP